MITFHTPEIADVLSAPATQRRIAEINSCLARGERQVSVAPGIANACAEGLRAAGWTVVMRSIVVDVLLIVSGPLDPKEAP